MSINKGTNKEVVRDTHTNTRKNTTQSRERMKCVICNNMMDLEGILLSEITLSKNDYCMMSLVCEI